MKSIITSVLTTIVMLIAFMILLNNIKSKEPIVTENVNIEQRELANEPGIIIDNSGTSNITTSAVVGIAVEKKYSNKLTQSLGNSWSVGSGFIIDSEGYIVTNHHVIGNAESQVYVTLYGGDTIKGRTIWDNADLDLAIVKIEVAGLPYMKLGDSKNLTIGELAYAIGNPLGFEFQRTVTAGIVSGINRSININGSYMEDLIQTDASINSGNSGGPLINKKGEVIGINTIKVESAEGMGFAIPINQIKPVIEKIKGTGKFDEPYLGIRGYDREMVSSMDSQIKLKKGIYVYDIENDSPAAESGIKKDDILLSMQNEEVNTMCELREILYRKNHDEIIKVTLLRDGISININVKIKAK